MRILKIKIGFCTKTPSKSQSPPVSIDFILRNVFFEHRLETEDYISQIFLSFREFWNLSALQKWRD